MGLISDFKRYREMKKFEKTLSYFGLTVEDLKKAPILHSNDYEKDLDKNEKKFAKKLTPEDDMELYDVEVEDLYPYGKR